jgi:hypothetical protein
MLLSALFLSGMNKYSTVEHGVHIGRENVLLLKVCPDYLS